MATISVVLNDQQRKKIIHDMNEQVEMLTDIEIEYLATKLNENVNIPFLKENKEQIILAKLVKKVDRYLYSSLPNELYECIKDTKEGISEEEIDNLINSNIPLICAWSPADDKKKKKKEKKDDNDKKKDKKKKDHH